MFSRNTIKASQSCMPNIKHEIHRHSKNTLEKAKQKHPDTQLCNCINKKQCPSNGYCLTESSFYHANITVNIRGYKEKVQLGVSKRTFKVWYCNHKKLFKNQCHTSQILSIEVECTFFLLNFLIIRLYNSSVIFLLEIF